MEPRPFFSIDEAERLIPELSRLLEYVRNEIALYQRWGREINQEDESVREAVREIESHGCVARNLRTGVIDFPAIRMGEPVYLCWRLGERRIRYWHRIGESCSKRKPLIPHEFYGEEQLRDYMVKRSDPLTEQEEDAHQIIITVDLRGAKPHTINVEAEEKEVTITWSTGGWMRKHHIHLKTTIQPNTITRNYKNGILTITALKKH